MCKKIDYAYQYDGYELMWKSVLAQVFRDIYKGSVADKADIARWVLFEPRRFELVCDLANVDPQKTKKCINKHLDLQKYSKVDVTRILEYKEDNKQFPELKNSKPVNFFYQNVEVKAIETENKIWIGLNTINSFFNLYTFSSKEPNIIKTIHFGNSIETKNIRRCRISHTTYLFTNVSGLLQLAKAFNKQEILNFVEILENGKYKENIIENYEFEELIFQKRPLLCFKYQNNLFIKLYNVIKIASLQHYKTLEYLTVDSCLRVSVKTPYKQLFVSREKIIEILTNSSTNRSAIRQVREKLVSFLKVKRT